MSRQFNLTQPQRLCALAVDIMLVAIACQFLFGTFYPPLGDKGFWAYSALLAVLVGSRLVTPFYVKPVDAISYAVPAFVSLMLIDRNGWSTNQRWGFGIASGLSALVILMGVANIVSNSLRSDWAKRLSDRLRIILDLIGRPEFVYAPLIIFAVFSFHSESVLETAVIFIVMMFTVLVSAGNFSVGASDRLRRAFSGRARVAKLAGQIVGFQEPGIVLLRQEFEGDIKKGDILLVADRHGPKKLVVALNHVGRSEGILVRAVSIVDELSVNSQEVIGEAPIDESAYHVEAEVLAEVLAIEEFAQDPQKGVIGLVAPDTTIETLYFEVTENSDLEAGRLVSARVGRSNVMYQIIAGLTKEEIVQQKNTYGYLRGQGQQIGIWDEAHLKFNHCAWLPVLNAPVYLEKATNYAISIDSVGHFPGTNFPARIKSIDDLVTHNTAVLGILGIGKSMLAIELVERIIAAGIKVICLDLTDQYSEELSDFLDDRFEEDCIKEIQAASLKDREEYSETPEEGGSVPNLKQAVFDDLSEFLDEGNARKLKIYNPAAFVASKQTNEPRSYQTGGQWERGAALWTVTPVEITQIVTEAALEILSRRMSKSARVCLVYEEAHALVPEWNSVVNEGDKNATSGTARAILQGRKFGLGCLLVTQRTANVTKTILNQCNTVFAMRTFDETGKEFLGNYIGRAYADTLSSLPERHAVFFGKASSCENPVLIRLNDQDEFRRVFRAKNQPPALPRTEGGSDRSAGPADGDFDDMPF